MTLGEFAALCKGFAESRGAKDETPTDDDYAEAERAYALMHSLGKV